ncbi:MAG: pyridoxamine 5'-phosphate oxidase family protein [Pseudomonadales bacterium]|nr:pyridoxamine 5'-phosphate oxidase family protein [Pseudomonadales bacterium]
MDARRLLYQENEHASAYLATVAPDGGPRVHPVFPVLADEALWLFIVDMSPKYRDLLRQPHLALHAFPTVAGGEELQLRGIGEHVSDRETRSRIVAATGGRQGAHPFEALFRCRLDSVLVTRWENWGSAQAWPSYLKWRAEGGSDV